MYVHKVEFFRAIKLITNYRCSLEKFLQKAMGFSKNISEERTVASELDYVSSTISGNIADEQKQSYTRC